jgi:D-alanyl-D-alanine carboxypeptidase/D-alanyl-D-alanine-endopeptidase (penicillin-binding protein 4)
MLDPGETAALTLKQLLELRGVRVAGGVRTLHGPPPLPAAQPAQTPEKNSLVIAEHVSPPLLESVRLTNKISHNLHAELFLRTVARNKTGIGSTDAGLEVEQDFLKAAGVVEGDVLLSDGSGLARDNLVTPRAVLALLSYVLRQDWGPEFLTTLPVAGVDGTLEHRLRNGATGLVEAKTGDIENVRALSGYATTLHGEYLVFAILGTNNPEHGIDATATIDAIATAMVETIGVTARATPAK